MFLEPPGEPWSPGRPPWQDLTQSAQHVAKRAESMRLRVQTTGATEKEKIGYQKLSETRKNGDYSPTAETRQKIREKLVGRDFGWREGRSKAVSIREQCDIVYVLKVTTSDGRIFGKWGSTKESSFQYREKELKRQGFSWERVYWSHFGELAPEAEATIGRALHKYPSPHKDLNFYGKTECFAWTNETLQLLQEVTNGLEENPAP